MVVQLLRLFVVRGSRELCIASILICTFIFNELILKQIFRCGTQLDPGALRFPHIFSRGSSHVSVAIVSIMTKASKTMAVATAATAATMAAAPTFLSGAAAPSRVAPQHSRAAASSQPSMGALNLSSLAVAGVATSALVVNRSKAKVTRNFFGGETSYSTSTQQRSWVCKNPSGFGILLA
eukprot:s2379_g13.t1